MPTCYVLVVGKREAQKVYGPFESEDEAVHWVNRYVPTGSIFQIVPVYDTIQA